MQADKYLLEMAAKAAGLEVLGDEHPVDGLNVLVNGRVYTWRPRHDDGDALRLAAACDLNIELTDDAAWANGFGVQNYQLFEWHDGDKCSAIRGAVLRASAAIGDKMP